MKKILLVLFIFLSSFVFTPVSKAEDTTPPSTEQEIQIPGVTCGDAEAEKDEVKKCCLSPNLTIAQRLQSNPDFCLINTSLIKTLCPAEFINTISDWLTDIPFVKKLNEEYFPAVANQFNPCINGNPSTIASDPNCICKIELPTTKFLCDSYLKNSNDYNSCVSCSDKGIWTSIGCVKNDINVFIQETVFGIGIGLGGTFSLLCIIYAAFMMQSSQGNPEKLKKAQEMITSCIMGLMLIIFSVFILRLIGVNIIRIPGFS